MALDPDLNEMIFIAKLTLSILYSSASLIVGVWMAEISLKQYKKYKSMPLTPWIKKRYMFSVVIAISYALIGYHYLIYVIGTIDSLNPNREIIMLSLIYSAVLLIIFSVGSLITWVMPRKLKTYFNRKFTSLNDTELSEDEIEKIFLDR